MLKAPEQDWGGLVNIMFKVGKQAVYPAHGVVKVKSVESKEICGTKRDFYILQVIDSDVTVMVPTDNADTVGLRPVINKKEINRIYNILKNKDKNSGHLNGRQSWNKRYREYSDKLKSGDIFEVAQVLKEDPRTARIPIVILTSKSLSSIEKRRLSGRIAHLARKSEFNRDEFVALLQYAVKQGRDDGQ